MLIWKSSWALGRIYEAVNLIKIAETRPELQQTWREIKDKYGKIDFAISEAAS
jgi:hypothetical protein